MPIMNRYGGPTERGPGIMKGGEIDELVHIKAFSTLENKMQSAIEGIQIIAIPSIVKANRPRAKKRKPAQVIQYEVVSFEKQQGTRNQKDATRQDRNKGNRGKSSA
jgi:hypothetical protein